MPDSDEDDDGTVPPLPPEDRLWRHPSELAAAASAGATVPAGSPASAGPPVGSSPAPGGRRRRAVAGVALLSGLAGAAATVVVLAAVGALAPAGSDTAAPPTSAPPTTAVRSAAAIAIAVAAAVVEVVASLEAGSRRGSGVVARSDGLVLTSAKLVAGADVVQVRWPSGREATATIEGSDPVTGLAALTVAGSGYATATLDMTTPEVGEQTLAVSARADGASPRVLETTVSSTGTHVDDDDVHLVGLIETDEPMPEDADGGALIDADGDLRGVCLSLAGDVGWAVPAEVALRVADDLRRLGHVDRGWLGIRGSASPVAGAVPAGFTIETVDPGSPAAEAGLAAGDVVIAVDDQRVRSLADVKAALTLTRPGQQVVVETARADAAPVEVHVTLGQLPADG